MSSELNNDEFFGQGLLEPSLQALRLGGNPLRRYATCSQFTYFFKIYSVGCFLNIEALFKFCGKFLKPCWGAIVA